MKSRFFQMFIALAAVGVMAVPSFAQQSTWVDFNDERGRMLFDTDDDEEKDIIQGDIDQDGDEDIVIVRKVPFSIPGARTNLLLMNEDGNLVDRTMEFIPGFALNPTDDRDVQLFDVNNDSWLDIVTCTTFSDDPRLYINNGDGGDGVWDGFTEKVNWFSPAFPIGPKFCAVAAGDVNMDGFDDLYFVDYDNSLENRLLINNGDETFTDESMARLSFDARQVGFGTSAFIVDYNYDGFNDIVTLESTVEGGGSGEGLGIEFCINDGSGNFQNVQVLESDLTYMNELYDHDNDGRLDMFVVSDSQDYILFNNFTNANGTINVNRVNVTNSQYTAGFSGNSHAADVDNDGLVDMAVTDVDVDIPGCFRRFALLRNNGATLTDPNDGVNPMPWNTQGTFDMCWIDINNDGNLDMFMSTCDGYHMFVNDAKPNILLGDANCDGVVNLLDVTPFIDLLTSGQYKAQADMNGDGLVNLLDVAGFVDALSG